MSEYIIATASTADLEISYLEAHNIPFISYTFSISGVEYKDDCKNETKQFIFENMRQDKVVTTAAIPTYAYYTFFKSLLESGKDLIYTDMSNAISSSINNAIMAINQVKEEFPDRKISFIDSYNVTAGLGLFVKQLIHQKENGASFDEIIEWAEKHKKEYIHRFIVDDLKWLKRGGRLSNASAFVGTILSIKPLLYVDEQGKLVAIDKVRGRKKCMKTLVETMEAEICDLTEQEELVIIHADVLDDANYLKNLIQERYPQLNKISILSLGPTIAAHVGPGMISVMYRGKKRII